ncbi:ACP S-malonyltransferase [Paenibacillus pabuli]|uniref:ACP S-malonyltransferase n=1 Tax=Paenibacillus pabuli TaxID=1472 RepID=UPI003CF5455B
MKKVAFLFPGQGSQYLGMCKSMIENQSIVKMTFEEASHAVGLDLIQICMEDERAELSHTEITQPVLLTAGVAIFRQYMRDFGVQPAYCAGHSLGEITALTCSGAISLEDAVKLVHMRGKFMQEAVAVGQGSMAAVSQVPVELVEEQCGLEKNVSISNYNSPNQIVISGLSSELDQVKERLVAMGAIVKQLNVSAPFHSKLMLPAAEKFQEELRKYSFQNTLWPIVSNVTAKVYKDALVIADHLVKQLTQPVRWYDTVRYLHRAGVTHVLELGPKSVLKNLMKDCDVSIQSYAYDLEKDRTDFFSVMSSEQERVPTVIGRSLGIAVATRNKNWDNEQYQQGVVIPYRRIQGIQDELDKSGLKPTLEQMQAAILMLESVFRTKGVPQEIRDERYRQLLIETGTEYLLGDFVKQQQYVGS